ncbi:U32 family peptidase [Defluviimonas sp. WL0024]|uniref:Ubiquinone biosynthesis protein UbiV n=1 Tax=Albidovulum salinarum TaxID=2984153 RepID=A0ABT2X864_9RHOB|nr:U32 family peptidase [Defluviimonas sp. WL0024]MCU9850139.1 U32 family peptidase [Defluviimonas sp. WL0024]
MAVNMELTLGPIPFHWSAEARRDFYARIADEAPVDTVYLGEVICSKRAPFFEADLPEIADRLERAGKRVVFSSLAEIMLKRERKATEGLCAGEDGREVEANNAAALLHLSGRPHRVGPYMNVYNEETMAFLAGRGATHFALPAELPRASVAVLAARSKALGVGTEVQVFGRASLALSARCYHARAHGRTKDNCQFVCEEDPDGMELDTMDGKAFLIVNGIQTMSRSYVNLSGAVPDMVTLGVTALRLGPQKQDMVAVAKVFRLLADGEIGPDDAGARLDALELGVPFSDGFWHGEAGYRRIAHAAAAGA